MVDTITSINKLCKLRGTSGSLVLYSIDDMVFISSTYEVIVNSSYSISQVIVKPFARVPYSFSTKDIGR